jgi:hypothetical protein
MGVCGYGVRVRRPGRSHGPCGCLENTGTGLLEPQGVDAKSRGDKLNIKTSGSYKVQTWDSPQSDPSVSSHDEAREAASNGGAPTSVLESAASGPTPPTKGRGTTTWPEVPPMPALKAFKGAGFFTLRRS